VLPVAVEAHAPLRPQPPGQAPQREDAPTSPRLGVGPVLSAPPGPGRA